MKKCDAIQPNFVFEDKNKRGGVRRLRIVQLEVGSKVLCENVATGRRTRVNVGSFLSRFIRVIRVTP